MTEYPEKTRAGQVVGFASLGIVIVSTLTFIMQTFPEFHDEDVVIKGQKIERNLQIVRVLNIIDEIAIMFFTVEYLVRQGCAIFVTLQESNLYFIIV